MKAAGKGGWLPQKNWLEWSVFAVALLLVTATIGYLTREALLTSDRPPQITVRLGEPRPAPGGYMVPVRVRNGGDLTAESVTIAVVLVVNGAERERAELTLAYLPRQATREGWVRFRADPRAGELRTAGIGFEVP